MKRVWFRFCDWFFRTRIGHWVCDAGYRCLHMISRDS